MGQSDNQKWAGFSDYEKVASSLHDQINRAVKAYAHIDSKDKQSVGITPQTAVRTREAILSITKRLSFEVEKHRGEDGLEEIHERWAGVEVGDDGEVEDSDDAGRVALLEQADFQDGTPPWLGDHIDDIVEAGWELGYTKAGMEKTTAPEGDDNAAAKEMFD